jgi:hypothetical protein
MSPGIGRLNDRTSEPQLATTCLGGVAEIEEISGLGVDSRSDQLDNTRLVSAEGYSSGQRGQTVNLLAMPT